MGPRCSGPTIACRERPAPTFHPGLDVPHAQAILRKGYNPGIDSYSGFREADRATATGLAGYLRERGRAARVRVRSGDRLLRGLDRLRRGRGRLAGLRDRGRVRAIDLDGSLRKTFAEFDRRGSGASWPPISAETEASRLQFVPLASACAVVFGSDVRSIHFTKRST